MYGQGSGYDFYNFYNVLKDMKKRVLQGGMN